VVGETDWQEVAMPREHELSPNEAAIRERSYYIWESEGFPEGKDGEHWLRAKAELEAEEETYRHARSVLNGVISFVMPRPLITAPPRKTTASRLDARKDALRA
jgi:hypothetical protein